MERLKDLRKEKQLTMKELGQKLDLAESTISLYESGKREPDYQTLLKIADFFNVSVDYLLGREEVSGNFEQTDSGSNEYVKIPVYGKIPAGIPTEMIEEPFVEDYEEINKNLLRGGNTYFGLKVKGDSMFPEFRNGDTLILKKQESCENGDYCAVSINHSESTFKKVLIRENGLTLQPLNPNYEPLFFSNQEVIDLPVSILGVVKEVRRSY